LHDATSDEPFDEVTARQLINQARASKTWVTAAHILGLKLPSTGHLIGRILSETLKNGASELPKAKSLTRISSPAAHGLQTVLQFQVVSDNMYFDVAGFPGRTVGLTQPGVKINGKYVVKKRARPAMAKKGS
jgi:hypothetical protein